MTDPRKQLDLEDERTAQKRYTGKLHEKALLPTPYEGPRNTHWTGTGLPRLRPAPVGQLIGRVALRGPSSVLDGHADFYIGETHADLDGIEVFSWAAPVACTFFRGTNHHELCEDVSVVRAFAHRNDTIVDFVDDVVCTDAPLEPFRKRGLAVPPAPVRPGKRQLPVPPQKTTAPGTPAREEPDPATPRLSPTTSQQQENGLQSVRAEPLLRAGLQAPRTKSLTPVLATLQPDQYELVTAPVHKSMIVEGQPGTGKTIVATHRAAYLVNDDISPGQSIGGSVLLLGPTDAYCDHVRDVTGRLTGQSARVQVLSLTQLMRQILNLTGVPRGDASNSWQDVAWELGILARRATQRLKAAVPTTLKTERAYEWLRLNGTPDHPVTKDVEWSDYLRKLPPFGKALKLRAHTPLLTFLQLEIAKSSDLRQIEHVIVDEAQDVTPLEWFLLQTINKRGGWTLLGDLNQRRSDHTPSSWSAVIEMLAPPDGAPVRKLKRGYRSTKPILEFANRLLPRSERETIAFQQDGPSPTMQRSSPANLGDALVRHVDQLVTEYKAGTVAVISADPRSARNSLRSAGWSSVLGKPHLCVRGDREVTVVDPDSARGLEFDAVVIVEPADFPQNYGRQGPLYTALTRPNRELVVLYAKSLPDALKRR